MLSTAITALACLCAGGQLAATGGAVQDTAGVLSLTRAEAVQRALAHNPQLEAARQQVAQVRAQGTQLVALPDPALSGSYDDETRVFQLGGSHSHTLGLGWTLPFPAKLRERYRMAGADTKAAQFGLEQARQLVAAQAAQDYDALLVAERHSRDLTEALAAAQDFVKRTQARFQAGTAAKLDVIKAQVDASQVQTDLISSERDISNARAALNHVLGRAVGLPLAAADTLATPAALPSLEDLRARAHAARPEVGALLEQRRSAHAAKTLAREYWLPDLDVGVEGSGSPGAPNSFSTGFGISFPLFFWQHQRGEVAEAGHRELELEADARDLSAQIEQEVRSSYADASTALRQVDYIGTQLLPAAREAYRIATVSYGLGGASALEVLDAKRAMLDAESQYADALGAANDAVSQLELAVGGPLEQTSSGDRSHD